MLNCVHKLGGGRVYAFDPTPKALAWLKEQNLPQGYRYYQYGLSDKNEQASFYLPENDDYVSGSETGHEGLKKNSISVQMRTLRSLMQITGDNSDEIGLLKMDIEGSEFKAIPQILSSKIKFDQLCIEVHQRFFKDGRKMVKKLIQTLNNEGYYITAVSDNYEELLFERFS